MVNLPVEIWDYIVQDVVSVHDAQHEDIGRDNTVPSLQLRKLLPRSYLIPLIRVCKSWYPTAEKYLYRSISIGSTFPPHVLDFGGEFTSESRLGLQLSMKGQSKRSGYEIALNLLTTLLRNPRLIKLVKELKLGVDTVNGGPNWTELNIQILLLCPNVEHVQIYGFHSSERHKLLAVLKTKSLVSFHVVLPELWIGGVSNGQTLIPLLDLMQRWPKLRSIQVSEPHNLFDRASGLFSSHQTGASVHFPELRTFVVTRVDLTNSDFSMLQRMCPNIRDFEVQLSIEHGANDATLNALVKCLLAWSSSLVNLKLEVPLSTPAYCCLSEALSNLCCLRELEINNMRLDVDSVADLPQLERLRCISLEGLTDCLENQDKFPAIKYISVRYLRNEACDKRLEDVCSRRGIQLRFRDEHVDTFISLEDGIF